MHAAVAGPARRHHPLHGGAAASARAGHHTPRWPNHHSPHAAAPSTGAPPKWADKGFSEPARQLSPLAQPTARMSAHRPTAAERPNRRVDAERCHTRHPLSRATIAASLVAHAPTTNLGDAIPGHVM